MNKEPNPHEIKVHTSAGGRRYVETNDVVTAKLDRLHNEETNPAAPSERHEFVQGISALHKFVQGTSPLALRKVLCGVLGCGEPQSAEVHRAPPMPSAQPVASLTGSVEEIVAVVRDEYHRQAEFGCSPSAEDYAISIRRWLEKGGDE